MKSIRKINIIMLLFIISVPLGIVPIGAPASGDGTGNCYKKGKLGYTEPNVGLAKVNSASQNCFSAQNVYSFNGDEYRWCDQTGHCIIMYEDW